MTRARLADLLLASAAIATIVAGIWLVPTSDGVRLPDGRESPGACWFHEVSGVPCPTCGMTRSYASALHGDVGDAFHWHPAGPLVLLASIALILVTAACAVGRREPLWSRAGFRFSLSCVGVITLGVGLLRYLQDV